jgi:hypothetical protein
MDGYYTRSADVASRVVDGEAVLVKMPEGVLHVLSPSASRMWVGADGVHSGAELAELAGGSGSAAASAFLENMAELGLLERAASPRGEADPYPQDVELPQSSDPPEVRATEPVETIQAGTTILFAEGECPE